MTVHNRKKQTLECLKSLYNEKDSFDVFLTDDGSTDGTSEDIRKYYPTVNIIKGDGNLYWNRGMLKAFKEASKKDYDYYLWLNDDTTFVNGFISKLIQCAVDESNKAIVCGATISGVTGEFTYGGFTKNVKSLAIIEKKQYCHFASGNILLIPRDVFNMNGYNNSFYRHALGDFDYVSQAKKKGIQIVQAPGYLGLCEKHKNIPRWRDSNLSLVKRFKHLYSPLGRNPIEFIYFDLRNNNVFKAILHFFTLHLRCIFPHFIFFSYNEKE